MRVYLDSSALIKRALREDLSGIIECPISDEIVDIARRLGPSTLRSLDAIHLATATLVGADAVCAYDKRLLASASELGFSTISPE